MPTSYSKRIRKHIISRECLRNECEKCYQPNCSCIHHGDGHSTRETIETTRRNLLERMLKLRPGAEHRMIGPAATPALPFAPPNVDAIQLRERFHRVILGAGYKEDVAQSLLLEWFDEYMKDLPNFLRMLHSYESGHGDD